MKQPIHYTALIVGDGASPGTSRLIELASAHGIVIAADGGLRHLLEAEIEPTHVTGDFDSIGAEELRRVPPDRQIHVPDQDKTDLEKAMRLAIEINVRRVGLVCVTGSRADHTFNAVSLMVRYGDRLSATLYDAHGDGVLVEPPGIEITGAPGEKISLIPAPGAVGLQSVGLLYAWAGTQIGFGDRDGISNELTHNKARIRFDSGRILLYRQRPFLPDKS